MQALQACHPQEGIGRSLRHPPYCHLRHHSKAPLCRYPKLLKLLFSHGLMLQPARSELMHPSTRFN